MTEDGVRPAGPPPRRLRILHVIHRLALGGTEYGVIKVVNQLDRARFEPLICSLRDANPEARAALREDVPVIELHRSEGLSPAILFKLADLIWEKRVDVIHSHNWTTYFYSVVAARATMRPVVVHGEHGRETAEASHDQRRLLSERILARGVDHFTAVSRDLCQHIADDWRIHRSRIRFIPNGVDLRRYDGLPEPAAARASLGLEPSERVVGAVGAFRDVKDYPTLMRAFEIVQRTRPDARLVMVGFDPQDRFRLRMEREMPGWEELRRRVTFTGIRTDVPQLLAGFDVYVSSSIYEGMSNTILEAMSARRPVVATRVGGTPDLVEEGVTGWMVPPGDPKALADRIGWVLDHPDQARAAGLAGRRRVEERHSFAEMVEGNAQVYEAAYARRHAPWRRAHRVRVATASAARWSGVLPLFRALEPPSLTVLAYHSVLPYAAGRGKPGEAMRLSSEIFEEQIEMISRRYRALGQVEVAGHFESRRPFPRHALWLTFDDGYADNARHAWPILQRYGIPATIFLVTDMIDQGGALWWDDLAESALRLHGAGGSALRDAANAADPRLGRFFRQAALGNRSLADAVDRTIAVLNRESWEERRRLTSFFHARAEVCDGSPRPRLMLTWDEVRAMRAGGISFGGHTASHAFLDTLSEADTSAEVERCLARIASETGERPLSFAYPRGRSAAASRRVLDQHGIRLAVTTLPGRNTHHADPLSLHRRDAGHLALGPRFSPHVFDLELAGWFDARHR